LALMQSGMYKLYEPDPSTHFDEDLIQLGFFDQRQPVSAIYFDGESKEYMVKRFLIETTDKKTLFISEHPNSRLEFVSTDTFPRVQLEFGKMGKFERNAQEILLEEFIAVKGLKAKGKRLSTHEPKKIVPLESLPEPEHEEEEAPVTEIETSAEDVESKPNVIIDLEGDEPQMRLFEEP
jgi:topoisomerase-4 subunit A